MTHAEVNECYLKMPPGWFGGTFHVADKDNPDTATTDEWALWASNGGEQYYAFDSYDKAMAWQATLNDPQRPAKYVDDYTRHFLRSHI